MVPMTSFLMVATGIISYPIAKILDALLGEHHYTRFTNKDLKALIDMHSQKALIELNAEKHDPESGLKHFSN